MGERIFRRKKAFAYLFICYLTSVLFLTLFTHNYYTYGKSGNFLIFSSLRLMIRSGDLLLILKNIAGNVILFFPLGLLLPMLHSRMGKYSVVLLTAFLFSLFIELCQYLFAARIFDVDDILLNITGCLTGRLIFSGMRFVYHRVVFFYSGS